jgi:hypothetical protein
MDLSELEPIVQSVAGDFARKFGRYGVEREDVSQELWTWVVKHPGKITEWSAEEHFEKILAKTLRHEANAYSQRAKADALGYSVSDLAWYSRNELKALLTAMFDPEAWTEPPVSEDGGRSRRGNPAEGGNWIALLADVAQAYNRLSTEDKALLAWFHGREWTNVMYAEVYGITQQSASNRHTKALNRLLRLLGGERPRNTHDDASGPCECETQYVGTRNVVSNAAARALTQEQYDEN